MKNSHISDFTNSLGILKIGLITFFIVVTIVYQLKFRNIQQANTFFGQKNTTMKVILDSITAGLIGIFTIFIVVSFRIGSSHIFSQWKACLIVFIILFLFNLALESSGLNRWLAESETAKGEGPYAVLDGTTTPEGREKFNNINKQGDFFITALAYTCLVFVAFIILYYTYRMIKATYINYKNNLFPIKSTPSVLGMSPYIVFILELLLVVVLNSTAPVISPKIRGEQYTRTTIGVVIVIAIIVFSIHIMFQYNGLYNFNQ